MFAELADESAVAGVDTYRYLQLNSSQGVDARQIGCHIVIDACCGHAGRNAEHEQKACDDTRNSLIAFHFRKRL